MILSSRGKRGLLAIKFTPLKEKLKGLLGRASGGLKIGTLGLFMAGCDYVSLLSSVMFAVFSLLEVNNLSNEFVSLDFKQA